MHFSQYVAMSEKLEVAATLWLSIRHITRFRRFDWLKRRRGFQILHCLGDSHVQMFCYLGQNAVLSRTIFRCTIIGGATAMGIVNPNSRTHALRIFRREIELISPKDHLLFMLGEVDCGFVIWYRAAKYNMSVNEQFETSLRNYETFITSTLQRGYRNIIICSVPLPTILDNQAWGEVADARREVRATLAERTDLTRQYNAALRQFCNTMKLIFLDFESDLLDKQSQLIGRQFLNDDPTDHHLNPVATAPILGSKLKQLGFS